MTWTKPRGPALAGWLLREAFRLTVAVLVAMLFTLTNPYVDKPAFGAMTLLDGHGERPFAYRALMVDATRVVVGHLPAAVHHKVDGFEDFASNRGTEVRPLMKVMGELGNPKGRLSDVLVFAGLQLVCFYLLSVFVELAGRRLGKLSAGAAYATGLAVTLLLPLFFRRNQVYDPSSIMFASALLFLAGRSKVPLFLGALALAVYNKESAAVFSLLAFAMPSETLSLGKRIGVFAAGAAIAVAVRAWLHSRFSGMPGVEYEFAFFENLKLLASPSLLFGLIVTLGPWVALASMDWRTKNRYLRNALVLFAPPFLLGNLLFGNVNEFRIFLELLPFLGLLAAPTVARLMFPSPKPLPGIDPASLLDEARRPIAETV